MAPCRYLAFIPDPMYVFDFLLWWKCSETPWLKFQHRHTRSWYYVINHTLSVKCTARHVSLILNDLLCDNRSTMFTDHIILDSFGALIKPLWGKKLKKNLCNLFSSDCPAYCIIIIELPIRCNKWKSENDLMVNHMRLWECALNYFWILLVLSECRYCQEKI